MSLSRSSVFLGAEITKFFVDMKNVILTYIKGIISWKTMAQIRQI
jgi:hypothetical protein